LDESERRDCRDRLRRQREITEERERTKCLHLPAPTPTDSTTGSDDNNDGLVPPLMVVSDSDDDDSDDESIPSSHQEGEIQAAGGDQGGEIHTADGDLMMTIQFSNPVIGSQGEIGRRRNH